MDVIHQSIGKALDQVGIEHQLFKRWCGHEHEERRLEKIRAAS
jgi:4-hydroxy-3-polyprenylbenzoate decarboxylase